MINRKVVAQCCATSVTDFLCIINGLSTGLSTLLVSELYHKDNAEIHVTTEQLTWIGSIGHWITPVGSLLSGPLSARAGRKSLIYVSAVMYAFAWSLLYGATDFWSILLGCVMLGFAGGVVNAALLYYLTEICEPDMRGFFIAKATCFCCIGTFSEVLLGNYYHWRDITFWIIFLSILTFIMAFFMPESPFWLASKSRLDKLKSSLRWLRGWTSSNDVEVEYKLLLKRVNRWNRRVAGRPRRTFAEAYLRRGVLLPLGLVVFVFVLDSCNGSSVLLIYAVPVFKMLASPLNEYKAATVLTGIQVPATILLMSTIRRFGKRRPTILSLAVAALCFLGVAIYLQIPKEPESGYSWIPMTLIFISMFAMTAGVRNTPWFFAGELFPMEVRSLAISLAAALYYVVVGVASKTFLNVLDAITLSGTFFLLFATNLVGFVFLYFNMPETEGKSLADIEKLFENDNSSINPDSPEPSNSESSDRSTSV